jgi:uncharacterized protein (TIGR02421 family)
LGERLAQITYVELVRDLSNRIIDAQKPIRVLDAIKWDASIERRFLEEKGRELPRIDADYYAKTSLGFDPKQKEQELFELGQDVRLHLGQQDEIAQLLSVTIEEYRQLVSMLAVRGTNEFYKVSRVLYGSPKDRPLHGSDTIREQGLQLFLALKQIDVNATGDEWPKVLSSDQVVEELKKRFETSFLGGLVDVRLDDGIVSDAAAGSDVIKIKLGARFSKKDVDIFEVHEGWAHIATSLNGKMQKNIPFLAKGPPRCVVTQEGLATLMEVMTNSIYPMRGRAIYDRVIAIDMVEDGADFIDVYRFYLLEGFSEDAAFRNAKRVFRGSHVRGGAPFTKDLAYMRGLIENLSFLAAAVRAGKTEMIPFLFCGKLHVDDVPLLYRRHLEGGLVEAPTLLPPQFRDMDILFKWISSAPLINQIQFANLAGHYQSLFKRLL